MANSTFSAPCLLVNRKSQKLNTKNVWILIEKWLAFWDKVAPFSSREISRFSFVLVSKFGWSGNEISSSGYKIWTLSDLTIEPASEFCAVFASFTGQGELFKSKERIKSWRVCGFILVHTMAQIFLFRILPPLSVCCRVDPDNFKLATNSCVHACKLLSIIAKILTSLIQELPLLRWSLLTRLLCLLSYLSQIRRCHGKMFLRLAARSSRNLRFEALCSFDVLRLNVVKTKSVLWVHASFCWAKSLNFSFLHLFHVTAKQWW